MLDEWNCFETNDGDYMEGGLFKSKVLVSTKDKESISNKTRFARGYGCSDPYVKEEKELVAIHGGSGFDLNLYDITQFELSALDGKVKLACERSEEHRKFLEISALYPVVCSTPCFIGESSFSSCEEGVTKYIFDNSLNCREVLYLSERVVGRREDFLSLNVNTLIETRVVNMVVDLLCDYEAKLRGHSMKFWFIPTSISVSVNFS
uniref:Uncharacterized protein n=1 Tax=Cannabis sativa TaxID=3483 RepID=A0A803R0I6_CANSA